MRFEWDDTTAANNIKDHRIHFEEAQLVFADRLAQDDYDGDHSDEEKRFQRIGRAGQRLLIVTYTMRGEEADEEIYHFISAREAEKPERRIYEEGDE